MGYTNTNIGETEVDIQTFLDSKLESLKESLLAEFKNDMMEIINTAVSKTLSEISSIVSEMSSRVTLL